MSTRRSILSGTAALVGASAVTAQITRTPPPPPRNGHEAGATVAEAAAGITPRFPEFASGDVRRYGITANDPAAAAANTAVLKALVAPGGKFAGTLWFANATGQDVYHLNDIIAFHDGVSVDLQGSTLHFSKAGERSDTNSGFIFAVRDFSISNGAIVVDYQMGGGGTSAGNALTFGNRGGDSSHFSAMYDSQLPIPMGNIRVRDLRITCNTKGGTAIGLTGGLNGVVIENVWIDGSNGALENGIYYEFGWATNEAKLELRQTSHACNMRFTNISVVNLNTKRGQAIGLTGAYNCWIDGLYVRSANILFQCSPGESAFYRPWSGVDQVGAKRNIALRNVVGIAISGSAIGVTGASSKAGGYLRNSSNGPAEQTDLMDCSIDGFAIDGANLDGGYGVYSSAERLDLRNGRITNFSRGIVTTNDCTRMSIDAVDVFGCRQSALQLGQQVSLWNPPRQKMGVVRNCFIAGNGVSAPGNFSAIDLDLCATFTIEGNRFGFEASHDGLAEGTQGYAVRLGAAASNVVCRCNHTGGVRAGGVAYAGTPAARGNTLENPSGVVSASGSWQMRK